MKHAPFILLLTFLMSGLAACDTFVDDVQEPIDSIGDEQLNVESQVPFLVTGIRARFASTFGAGVLLTAGLSDEMIFDSNVPTATFPSYGEIDRGQPNLDNFSVDGMYQELGELRFFADELLRRIEAIGTFERSDLREEGLFAGNFFGGVARYLNAAWMGLEPGVGGGVIDGGPFIPSDEMFGLAAERFESALGYAAPGSANAKSVHTALARIRLYQGDYSAARTEASQGLAQGDAPLEARFSDQVQNPFFFGAGRGRVQFVAAERFEAFVSADGSEANRIPLFPVEGKDGSVYQAQDKYGQASAPIPFVSWQENELILAELDLRAGDAASALARVNIVRASHGVDPLASIDMNGLIAERDVELWLTGNRLMDQRRFDLWHLGANTWQYLPITAKEREANPNL